jgi:hypothetical protein
LLLKSERERLWDHADAERDPQYPARFYETSRNREKETQHEDDR